MEYTGKARFSVVIIFLVIIVLFCACAQKDEHKTDNSIEKNEVTDDTESIENFNQYNFDMSYEAFFMYETDALFLETDGNFNLYNLVLSYENGLQGTYFCDGDKLILDGECTNKAASTEKAHMVFEIVEDGLVYDEDNSLNGYDLLDGAKFVFKCATKED